jgi:soluble lytic murein transglycosylase-like protein
MPSYSDAAYYWLCVYQSEVTRPRTPQRTLPAPSVSMHETEARGETQPTGIGGYLLVVALIILALVGGGAWLGSALAPDLAAPQPDSSIHANTFNAPIQPAYQQYVALARQDAIDAGITPTVFERQIDQESGFNPRALSPAGAKGIAQFMPATAAGLGIDPWNPVVALRAAASYMAQKLHLYDGNYPKALAAYNAGDGAVAWAVRMCGRNWLACMPTETQNYVRVILNQ